MYSSGSTAGGRSLRIFEGERFSLLSGQPRDSARSQQKRHNDVGGWKVAGFSHTWSRTVKPDTFHFNLAKRFLT